jgi:hypothetical protein
MLLTVFGMLSWEMVIKDTHSKLYGHTTPVKIPFLCSDYCFITRKHCLKQMASILACNVDAVLLIPCCGQWTYFGVKASTLVCYLQLRDSP